jgi:hypothetical protein
MIDDMDQIYRIGKALQLIFHPFGEEKVFIQVSCPFFPFFAQ